MGENVELRQRDVKATTENINNGDAHNNVTSDKTDPELNEDVDKCTRLQDSCTACCIPCLKSYNPLPENANIFQKIRHGFLLPPHGSIASYLQFAVVCLQVWIVLYAWTHEAALPGGNFFSLLVLFICCVIGGYLISFVHLPPLLGMLIMGLLLKNIPVIKNVGDSIDGKWSAALRKIALTVILTRAGLGLDVIKLKKLSWAVLRLAFIPCAAEIITAGVVSRFLLGFPWTWSLMLGCILGALSPAVTVPSLVSLQDRRYGVAKGIPTMLLAAGGLDNVLCVTGFSVFFGIIFSDSDLVVTIFKGPIGVIVGLLYGFVAGIFMWYIPAKDCGNKTFFRSMILLGAGLVAIFGSSVIKLSGAGPIGCLTTATVAAYKWRQRRQPGEPDEVANVMALSWLIVQHFLFGLIGSAVDVSKIQSNTAGLGIATLAIGLTVRSVFSFTVTMGTGFNIKERVFVTLTWLSKATVQAAVGGLAIAEVMLSENPDPDYIKYGTDVLTISVLAIIICAPIGATLMAVLGPRFLVHGDDEDVKTEEKPTNEETVHDIVCETETGTSEETPAEIKPIKNNQFKSELSMTLQNRLSRQSLIENDLFPNNVHKDHVPDKSKGIDNPVFDDNELVNNQKVTGCTSGKNEDTDNEKIPATAQTISDRSPSQLKDIDNQDNEENQAGFNHEAVDGVSSEQTNKDMKEFEDDEQLVNQTEADRVSADTKGIDNPCYEECTDVEIEQNIEEGEEKDFPEPNPTEENNEENQLVNSEGTEQDTLEQEQNTEKEIDISGMNLSGEKEGKFITKIQILPPHFQNGQ